MTEQPSRSALIAEWLRQHATEVDAVVFGEIVFVFSGRAPPRVKVARASRLTDDDEEQGG